MGGWRIVSSPNPSTDENDLYKIYVTFPGDVWAVGASDESGSGSPGAPGFIYAGLHPLLLHWNGQTWDEVDSPAPGAGGQLLAVTGSTSLSDDGKLIYSDWAVGAYINTAFSPSQTLVEHITPPAYPLRTTSYYELTTNTAIHHQQGCAAATPGDNNSVTGLVFLDYGQPRDWSTSAGQHDWGTWLVPHGEPAASRIVKIADIQAAVESFIDGYASCVLIGSPRSTSPSRSTTTSSTVVLR